MQDAKPYQAPDFQAERSANERRESRLEYLTRTAAEQLKAIRKRYEEQIKALVQAHRSEIERVSEESFKEGRQKGLDEGHISVQNALESLEKLGQGLAASEKAFLLNAERHVITLALAVAKRIIGREVESDREIVLHTVRESLKQVADKATIIIRVNPEELDNVISHRRELQAIDRNFPELEFEADEKISLGACVVETRTGSIDGRFESQLEEIERNFIGG
ncbi:MAG: hypothetical protein HQ591_07290 [candidate division Zixibacteria bacterium]|nr:hypothetical protein [Candidatus Tariuqbacter arcticus]